MVIWNQHRADVSFYTGLSIAGNTKKLDGTAHLFCIADVLGGNFCDSFDINIIKYHSGIKSNAGENSHLASCIKSINIRSRIRFCIAKLCGKCQCIFKFHILLGHFCEDEVGSTVYNTHDLAHVVACQALLQRTDNRYSACYSCFKEKIHMGSSGCVHKFFSVDGNQIFVCCYYVLACVKSIQNIGSGRFDSTDQFDYNVNGRICFNILPAIGKDSRIIYLASCLFQVADKYFAYFNLAADLGCHFFFLVLQNLVNTGSNCSKPKQGCVYNFFSHGELPS